jgi:endopeptidase La
MYYNQYKLFKLFNLENKYKEMTELVFNLVNHINILDSLYLIENYKRNELLSELFNINKNINNYYNNYITSNIDKLNITNINPQLIELVEQTDEANYKLLKPVTKLLISDTPYINEKASINNIINNVGYHDLIVLLELNNINYNNFNSEVKSLIDEINNYFVPISFNTFNVDSKENLNYYWRIPTIYNNEDILQLTRELWIKKSTNSYYKIEGYFRNDSLALKLKTSQLSSPYLYKKKSVVLKEVMQKNCDVDLSFTKKFIKYDYIGNIYCMSNNDYINYLINSYKLYLQITKLTFVNIMKNFINNGSKLYNLYFIIFLLLLGNDDNADIASLLINLTKEKKINSIKLYNLLNNNLSFFMQLKIKKGGNNIQNELDKIKTLTIETVDYKKQLLSIKNIPEHVKQITLDKIEEMKAQNNEFYKQKTFVDNILKYPWSTNDNFFETLNNDSNKIINYLDNVKDKLNTITYGHNEAKNVLLQTIACWITNPASGGKPLGFVGPPGVGKTLLAKSISKALNIPFAEITLGGQNDGELLHGHGYTYSGSQPGLIIKKMVEMGKERCILYFDELDKTASKHGSVNEITSILIHLTDPNMNKSFQDRFFQGVDFPLDKVIMIFSYNDSDKIDPILLDRINEITIKPYTIQDKILIVRNFVIPEIKSQVGIKHDIVIEDNLIEYIIYNYTNEAGIRDIKRKIEKIFLTLNLEIITNQIDITTYKFTIEEVTRILLKPKNFNNKIHLTPEVGIINGLYASANGDGGIVPIQIFNNTSTTFEIKLTGKQGDVMKESVFCALTCAIQYVKTKYNIDTFKNGFHVHAPATATPKDGPSAGCAFTCAFISRILNKPIRNDIGMTGEIELTGKITKIGGLDFKLIGAKKAGIKLVFIPLENKEDLDEIKEKYKLLIDDDFKVEPVEYLTDLIDKILVK